MTHVHHWRCSPPAGERVAAYCVRCGVETTFPATLTLSEFHVGRSQYKRAVDEMREMIAEAERV